VSIEKLIEEEGLADKAPPAPRHYHCRASHQASDDGFPLAAFCWRRRRQAAVTASRRRDEPKFIRSFKSRDPPKLTALSDPKDIRFLGTHIDLIAFKALDRLSRSARPLGGARHPALGSSPGECKKQPRRN
jgi:hypothetical protein